LELAGADQRAGQVQERGEDIGAALVVDVRRRLASQQQANDRSTFQRWRPAAWWTPPTPRDSRRDLFGNAAFGVGGI
jgi:hypothetical protein